MLGEGALERVERNGLGGTGRPARSCRIEETPCVQLPPPPPTKNQKQKTNPHSSDTIQLPPASATRNQKPETAASRRVQLLQQRLHLFSLPRIFRQARRLPHPLPLPRLRPPPLEVRHHRVEEAREQL